MWDAITNASEMRQWFFDNIPDFSAEVGFETSFNVKAPSRDFFHIWKVTEVVPLQKLTYSWRFKGFDARSFTTWELFDEGNQTLLRVTAAEGYRFPQDIPEFQRESGVGGWNYFIKERLKGYFEKK